jgi:hypothetical protein
MIYLYFPVGVSKKVKEKFMTQVLKWSLPGKAVATVLFPSEDINHTLIAIFRPGNQYEESKRAVIGDRHTTDDLIEIENFDHALKRIRKKSDRIIHVELMHEKKSFKVYVAFSFLNADGNPGNIYEVTTNDSGLTFFDVLAEL